MILLDPILKLSTEWADKMIILIPHFKKLSLDIDFYYLVLMLYDFKNYLKS